jgi:hypothetical protein
MLRVRAISESQTSFPNFPFAPATTIINGELPLDGSEFLFSVIV